MAETNLSIVVTTPNLNLSLAPSMRADEAVRVIMQRLLEMMNANVAGVYTGVDPEFLHSFRIAVRRSRSLLGQIRGVIPQHSWQRYSRGFAWLGEITRSVRDLDVYLLMLDDDKNSLVPAASNELVSLREFFQHQQQLAHQQLIDHLKSPRYTKLIAAWAAYLASPLPVHSRLPNAQLALPDFANQRIWRMLRRVVKQGNAIGADNPPQDLHELRKSCKKLRYLMEFFRSVYPVVLMKQQLKLLKSLQDVLGEYQDLQVQQGFLTMFQQSLATNSPVSQRTLALVDLMLHRLEKRKNKVRKLFKQRFAVFVETKHQHAFRKLFKN